MVYNSALQLKQKLWGSMASEVRQWNIISLIRTDTVLKADLKNLPYYFVLCQQTINMSDRPIEKIISVRDIGSWLEYIYIKPHIFYKDQIALFYEDKVSSKQRCFPRIWSPLFWECQKKWTLIWKTNKDTVTQMIDNMCRLKLLMVF